MFAWISSPDSPPRTMLHSEEIPSEENGWSGQNYTGYASTTMDEAIDRIEVECGEAEQAKWWRAIQTCPSPNEPCSVSMRTGSKCCAP